MMTTPAGPLPGNGYEQPPFLYEIRVKGRLSAEQWTSWFEELTVQAGGGESLLRGRAQDHAALYGLLARLRDLAIPLVAVKVLDAEAQRRLAAESRRLDLIISGALAALYLLLLGGLTTITIFVTTVINTALALALLLLVLGLLAQVFWLWSGRRVWRWMAAAAWPAAFIAFLVFIPVSGLLPTAVALGVMLFLAAGGIFFLISYLRGRAAEMRSGMTWGDEREEGLADESSSPSDSSQGTAGESEQSRS